MRLAIPADFSRHSFTKLIQDHSVGIAVAAIVSVTVATLAHDRLFHSSPSQAAEAAAGGPIAGG